MIVQVLGLFGERWSQKEGGTSARDDPLREDAPERRRNTAGWKRQVLRHGKRRFLDIGYKFTVC